MGFRSVPDAPPYPASRAYGVRTVPTLFVIDERGIVVEAVEVVGQILGRVSARRARWGT